MSEKAPWFLLMAAGFALIAVGLMHFLIIPADIADRKACEAKGGTMIYTRDQEFCIRKDALIQGTGHD